MKPYYDHGGITIYHGDAYELLQSVKADAVITDPPYGMGWDTDSRRFKGGASPDERGRGVSWDPVVGDNEPFDPAPLLGFKRVVLFGANHFGARLPVGTTLVWVKRRPESFGAFLSDAEVAWMKGGHGVYCFEDLSANGAGANYPKLHPTQKTERVMSWCMQKAGVQTDEIVLDPFCGSGTTLAAAKRDGLRAIGIETEECYCETAAKRLAQGVLPFG